MRQGGLLQILYKKNLPHSFVDATHGFSNVSIRQVTPIVATLAMGLMTAIMVLMYERRLKFRRREVARVAQQDPDRRLRLPEVLLPV
jgi:hypothetical protein